MTAAQYLTVAQAAERLGCCVETILSNIRGGALRAADISPRPGGRPTWRIDPTDLDLFLATRTTTSPPASSSRRLRRRQTDPAMIEYF